MNINKYFLVLYCIIRNFIIYIVLIIGKEFIISYLDIKFVRNCVICVYFSFEWVCISIWVLN